MGLTDKLSVILVLTCMLTISAVLAQPPSIKSCIATTTELAKKEIKALIRDPSLNWDSLFADFRSYLNTAYACDGLLIAKTLAVSKECTAYLDAYKAQFQTLPTQITPGNAADAVYSLDKLSNLVANNCDYYLSRDKGSIRNS